MSDPERISKRAVGLAAELLHAGASERPGPAGMARTLAALGVSGVALTVTSVASGAAAAGGAGAGATATAAGLTGAKAVNVVTAAVVAKWIGLGVVGGMGLAGAAAVVSGPATPVQTASLAASPVSVAKPSAERAAVLSPASAASSAAAPPVAVAEVPAVIEQAAPATPSAASEASEGAARSKAPNARAAEPAPIEVGTPLAAEVAFVDGARAALAAGETERGLAQLRRYELEFAEARLLPEVLFLRMEASERLARTAEARAAAQRLVEGFPKSPHAARARRLLVVR